MSLGKLAVLAVMMASPAFGQSNAEIDQAMNNVQHEMSRCIAYNMVVVECVKPQDAALADRYRQINEHQLGLAYRIGRSVGMTNDAMTSRVILEVDGMMRLIAGTCTNIGSLNSRYGYRCKQVVENGDSSPGEYLKQ